MPAWAEEASSSGLGSRMNPVLDRRGSRADIGTTNRYSIRQMQVKKHRLITNHWAAPYICSPLAVDQGVNSQLATIVLFLHIPFIADSVKGGSGPDAGHVSGASIKPALECALERKHY